MEKELKSLKEIFDNQLFRIPDYQRGYSWRPDFEIKDFWEDLIYLQKDRIHFSGVITIEGVKDCELNKWQEDNWLIIQGFHATYVVDGQQRLTTAVILIQAILESISPKDSLKYQTCEQIRKQYIYKEFKTSAEGVDKRSYCLSYEADDPSDEYLKAEIFGQCNDGDADHATLYTKNLFEAKKFFLEKLSNMDRNQIEEVFFRLTRYFKFKVYDIDDEIDSFVLFETTNNRGRKLSSLELLKNRLIYLSTQFEDSEGGKSIRQQVNKCWKIIYQFLGKNADAVLSDENFLKEHWMMYFGYDRSEANKYRNFLLKKKFTVQEISKGKLTVELIDKYVKSLQSSIKPWYYIQNPCDLSVQIGSEENRILLDRINRLGFRAFRPLIMTAYVKKFNDEFIKKLLIAAERFNFLLFTISQRKSNTGDSEIYRWANKLFSGELSIDDIVGGSASKRGIHGWVNDYFDFDDFIKFISNMYEDEYSFGKGFYEWGGLEYFLYEYEQHLKSESKSVQSKLSWQNLIKTKKNVVTIEHIYPQDDSDEYWSDLYREYDAEEKKLLTHSLGNLLTLSLPKNSALQKFGFERKKNDGKGVGYFNGSYSENEVGSNKDWTAAQILKRGMKLLQFMEIRWDISIERHNKIAVLHLGFLESKN